MVDRLYTYCSVSVRVAALRLPMGSPFDDPNNDLDRYPKFCRCYYWQHGGGALIGDVLLSVLRNRTL